MILLGCYQGSSLLSRLIKWETRSDISHVSIVVIPDCKFIDRALEAATVYEAWGEILCPWKGGVFKRHGINDGHKAGTVIKLMQLLPEAAEKLDEVAMIKFLEGIVKSRAGYDYMGLIRFLLRIKGDDPNNFFCSELAYKAFEQGGVKLIERTTASIVAPGDLYKSPLLCHFYTATTKGERV